MSINVTVDSSDWDNKNYHLKAGIPRFNSRFLEEGSALVEEQLRREVPVRTGKLRSSVTRHDITDNSAKISTTSGYGKFVDQGTGPHIIEGNPILRIPLPTGENIFRRRVNHPGFPGRHFKDVTIKNVAPDMRNLIINIIRQEAGFR